MDELSSSHGQAGAIWLVAVVCDDCIDRWIDVCMC